MMNKFMDGLLVVMGYFLSVAFMLILVQIAIHFHKSALGIYKIEREIQQIHQRLEEKAPVDNNGVQNGAEIG